MRECSLTQMQMIKNYPCESDAPLKVLQLEGGCGVIAAWSVMKHFHKRVSSQQLIELCRYTESDGVFTIAMAVALHQLGLSVAFHTDVDLSPKPVELECYKIFESLGQSVLPGVELSSLIEKIDAEHIAIVLYKEDDDGGHFSPLLGAKGEKLLLPYSISEGLTKPSFIKRWDDPEICRQCVIVSRQ